MQQKTQRELDIGTGAKGEAPPAAADKTEACAATTDSERPAVFGPSMEAILGVAI